MFVYPQIIYSFAIVKEKQTVFYNIYRLLIRCEKLILKITDNLKNFH